MTISDWLTDAVQTLTKVNVASARLDALVLLEDELGKDRSWLLAHPEHNLTDKSVEALSRLIKRRSDHEPLAYIRGRSEFYGRQFKVTPDTLQPRPETEAMMELFEKIDLPDGASVADIGTGSGAIAISAKLMRPTLTVYATEINRAALLIAKQNTKNLGADVKFYEGNLLAPILDRQIDVILANLPYVPDGHTINQAAMQEPKIAIFGGPDGLNLYRDLFEQISNLKQKPKFILTESLPYQHAELQSIVATSGYKETEREDFIQVFTLIKL